MCSPEATKSLLHGYNSLLSFSPSFSALSGAPRHYCYKFLRQFHGDGEMGPGVMAFSMDSNAPKHRPPTTGSWWQHSPIDQSIHSTTGKQASTTHLKAPPESIDYAI
ncbi:unnamed protein product [Sphagnum balticum]